MVGVVSTSLRLLLGSVAVFSLTASAAKVTCYEPDGHATTADPDGGWIVCNPTAAVSTCCRASDYCMTNGVCLNGAANNMLSVQGCTAKEWLGACNSVRYCNTLTSLALCGSDNKYTCISYPQGTWNCSSSFVVPPGQVLQIGHTSSTSTGGGSTNQTAPPESSTLNPDTSSSSESRNIAIGLGVGIPAVVILAGALIFFGLQYRKARKATTRGPADQQYTPVQHLAEQHYAGSQHQSMTLGSQYDRQLYGSSTAHTPTTYKPELAGQTTLRELGDNRPPQIHELQGQDEEPHETGHHTPVRDGL